VKRGEGEKEWYNVSKKSGWGFWWCWVKLLLGKSEWEGRRSKNRNKVRTGQTEGVCAKTVSSANKTERRKG
jgi:hypothetical protein